MWSVKCVNWFPVCLLAPRSVWGMLMCFLPGTWEVQAGRLRWDAETSQHFSVFAHHDAGHPAPWKPVLVVVQWYVMLQHYTTFTTLHITFTEVRDIKYFHKVLVSISVLSPGSLYIYNICRFLMSMSQSAQVTSHSCFLLIAHVLQHADLKPF